MSVMGLIWRELLHGKANALLTLLGVAAAVSLFVVFFSTGYASQQETRRVMRDLGYNLRIIPATTDMDRFWGEGFSDDTMPQAHIDRLAATEGLSYNHLIGFLQRRIPVGERTFVLTGISSEQAPPGKKKPSMIFEVPEGSVYLGQEAARYLGAGRGDQVRIMGREFQVDACLGETGTADDIRIYGALSDVQALLGLPGRVNEIKAIDCLCLEPDQDPLNRLRAQLAELLPDARLIQLKNLADARARERATSARRFAFLLPVTLLLCAVWVAVLGILNVRRRHEEIGVLRALGFGSGAVAGLFLGRAASLGLLGAAVGVGAGAWLANAYGPDIFKVTAGTIRTDFTSCAVVLVGAPMLAAVASVIPALLAVSQEPARTLRQD